MIMSKKTVLISEDVFLYAEDSLKNMGRTGRASNRLQAIIAAYKHGIKHVAEVLDVSRASIHRWVNLLRDKGVDGLRDVSKPARSKLNEKQKNILKVWIEDNPALTIREIGIKIAKEFKLEVGKSSIHRTLTSLGFSHITGRQKHYKSDEQRQNEFKKNSKN
jgi:transposase